MRLLLCGGLHHPVTLQYIRFVIVQVPRGYFSISCNMSGCNGSNLCCILGNQKMVIVQLICISLFFWSNPQVGMFPAAAQSMCSTAGKFANGSKFESNMDTVLSNLIHSSKTGLRYSNSSYGENHDKIYGFFQCRGDASQAECYNCSQDAKTEVRAKCGNAIGGRVWMDKCYLRYENYSFVSTLDTFGYNVWNVQNITDPQIFNDALRSFLSNLSAEASAPANRLRYSSGSTIDSSFHKIFGLVQCWEDISADDCTTCLSTAIDRIFGCCAGKLGGQALLGSCMVRFESGKFFNSPLPSPPNPSAKTPAKTTSQPPQTTSNRPSETRSSKKSSKKLIASLAIVGAVVVALIIIICLYATRKKRRSAKFRNTVTISHDEVQEDISDSLISVEQISFDLETLMVATRNFHNDNKLGEGGFGPVYKGITSDGREIAVKKLSMRSGQGKREFMNEVNLMAKIHHRNLLRLLGCCAEGQERMLVYEYLPNKSLDTILFDPQRRKYLDWEKRYNIILGTARGLLYLHEDSQLRIIHRDIKASNILLDDRLNPKIADFGLARLFPEDETHVSTRVAGTYGYMAPEYAMRGQLTVKADVYSFGVLLLEIVSGRKNTDSNLPQEMQTLLGWAWRLYKQGHILDMIDPVLVETCPHEQALRCIHVGLLCTQADASLRPLISNITLMISSSSVTLPDPTKPAFVNVTHTTNSASGHDHAESQRSLGTTRTSATTSVSSVSSHGPLVPESINHTSISDLEAR